MRSLAVLFGILILCMACAAPQVTIPVGVASVAYAQARADYATAAVIVSRACAWVGQTAIAPQGAPLDPAMVASRGLDKESCETARAISIRAQTLRQSIEAALMNPTQPIDWAQVLAYTAGVTELALKLGVAFAK